MFYTSESTPREVTFQWKGTEMRCNENEIKTSLEEIMQTKTSSLGAGHGSLVGRASADGRRFNPHVRQHSSVEIGHEIISVAILSLPLIQEGQLSVTGKRMCLSYW